jgi:hypothetical protein
MNTDGVEERRVLEGHRRNGDTGNPDLVEIGLVEVLGGIVCLVHCAVLLGLPVPFWPLRG